MPEPSATASVPPPLGFGPAIGFGAALFAILPLSTDIYLPAMLDIARDFATALPGVQRTMAAFTLGFGAAHLVVGGLADRFGRRPVALAGLALFAGSSLLGALAPTLDGLVAARGLQGAAAATGPILARAIVRDAVPAARGGQALSLMGALVGLAPMTAPLLGFWASAAAGWRATLVILAAYAAALLLLLAAALPETLDARHRSPGIFGAPVTALRRAAREPAFLLGGLAMACGYGALFTWLSTSAFLLIGDLRLAPGEASALYALGSAGYLCGGLTAAAATARLPLPAIMAGGALLTLLGTGGTLALLAWDRPGWVALLGAMLPFYVGWGVCQPVVIALAMRPLPEIAGQASAWLGAIQQVGGLAFSLVAVRLGGGTMSVAVMAAACAGLLAISLAALRPWRRPR